MKKLLRKNLLVDFGPAINQLGAKLITTPDKYKRINNIGTIVLVGEQCQLFTKGDVGKRIIAETYSREDCRFNPDQSEKLGLKPHWHIRLPESYVEAVIE